MTHAPRGSADQGIVLILVSVLLTLLVLAGIALLGTSRGVRQASRAHVQTVRAVLLARSGVERAVQAVARRPVPGTGPVSPDDWRSSDPSGTPIEESQNPSLHDPRLEPWLDDGDGTWDGEGFTDRNGNGRYDGASGRLRGAHRSHGDTYTLRIEDESAKINVNGGLLDVQDRDGDSIPDHRDADVRGDPADPKDTGRGWNFQLARILDTLGTAQEDWDRDGVLDKAGMVAPAPLGEDWNDNGRLDPAPIGISGLGAAVLANRPAGGYVSVESVRDTLAATLGAPVPDLTPYLTVSSWSDASVVHPNGYPLQTTVGAEPGVVVPALHQSISEVMTGRRALSREEGGRPPVNLNAADPHVLAALVSGTSGSAWHGGEPRTDLVVPASCVPPLVDSIRKRRRTDPYDTWEEFARHCDTMSQPPTMMAFPPLQLPPFSDDLLEALFNPNTMSVKGLPDQLMWRRLDKTDLIVWSTEGSLGPTGTFRIVSWGRVAAPDWALDAAARVDLVAEVFRPLRQTTQEDFVAGRRPDATGESYLSLADTAWRTTGAGASWNAWEAGRGLAVVTTPSPMAALPDRASGWDGAVSLATTEWEEMDFAPGKPQMFLHHFDDTWDADRGGDPARDAADVSGARLQSDPTAPSWPDPSLPSPQNEPNPLLPDGFRGDAGSRMLVFRSVGNLPAFSGAPPGNRAVWSYWVKSPVYSTQRRTIHAQVSRGGVLIGPGTPETHAVLTGDAGSLWGVLVENGVQANDDEHEHESDVPYDGATVGGPRRWWGFRWHLVTAAFDTNEPSHFLQSWAEVGAVRPHGTMIQTRYTAPLDPLVNEDLLSGDSRLILGKSSCTIDEFAVYDLGDDAAAARADAARLHADRFREGRYYKGDDGAFLSAPLRPFAMGASRVLFAQWTAYRPSETRREYFEGDQGTPVTFQRGRDRMLDPALARARVEVDLVEEGAVAPGAAPPPILTLSQGGTVGVARDRFRYRVRFVNGLTELGLDPLNQGVLESPWFDDITFYVQPASGPRWLAWRHL